MAFDLSGLAGATPYGAAFNAAADVAKAALGGDTSLKAGPVTTGPKSINISGFGGRSSGSATQSLTQAEPDRGLWFPSSSVGDSALPDWALPVAGVVLLVVLVGVLARRK